MRSDRDFLKQLHVFAILDRLFAILTPLFVASAVVGAVILVTYKG